jgi:hypothetical protein
MPNLNLTFTPDGQGHTLYSELIDLRRLGPITCTRASVIEFNPATQQWEVQEPDTARVLYQHPQRSACLDWEQENLQPVIRDEVISNR